MHIAKLTGSGDVVIAFINRDQAEKTMRFLIESVEAGPDTESEAQPGPDPQPDAS